MKTAKSGSRAAKASSYIHYNRLRFLEASLANKDTENSFNAENASASKEVVEVQICSAVKSPKPILRKRRKITSADERLVSILEQSLAQKNVSHPKEDDDEDKLFCLSLVKEMKKIPENKRLHTKIAICNLILQSQNVFRGPQNQTFENYNYRNQEPQQRNYLSQEQRNQASVEAFQYDYKSQQSSVPNNLTHYGNISAMEPLSPPPTDATNESELNIAVITGKGKAMDDVCRLCMSNIQCDDMKVPLFRETSKNFVPILVTLLGFHVIWFRCSFTFSCTPRFYYFFIFF